MYIYVTALGVGIEFGRLACDVFAVYSENHRCILSFVGYKIQSLLQTPGVLLVLKTFPLTDISVKTIHLGNLFRA